MTLGDLLEKQARRYSAKTFLFFQSQEVSYKDLDETTSRFASGLAELDIKKRSNVCILLPNCPEFLYAFFGIMKAGAVAVPINFNLKGEEIKYILNNSEATVLITAPAFLETIRQIRSDCPSLSHLILTESLSGSEAISFTELFRTSGRTKPIRPEESDSAAIIYTSGTTGHPKGVVLTHRNYLFDTEQFVTATQMTEQDRFLCILPLFHVNGQVVT
ncbi:MAG: AMP-binding protein, partial [Nitrospira sp.]|nr:AMP-binding protein [Nitrospira sp.]